MRYIRKKKQYAECMSALLHNTYIHIENLSKKKIFLISSGVRFIHKLDA